MLQRRRFLGAAAVSSIACAHGTPCAMGMQTDQSEGSGKSRSELDAALTRILDAPVLNMAHAKEPVKIESIELLRDGSTYLLRTRSSSGLEVITVPHQAKIGTLYPILLRSIVPVFIGRDARDLEMLLWEVYRHADNYKLQGLALWVTVAAVEMGLLELLSHASGKPLAEFFGGAWLRILRGTLRV